MGYTLIIGDKNYSTWSLRAWLVLRHFDIAFEEEMVLLDEPEMRPTLLQYSPAGRVPILLDGNFAVWDSLAIIEYLAEAHVDRPIWPPEPRDRARARSLAAEMHSGFDALRSACPMNLRKRFAYKPRGGAAAERDKARFEALVREQILKSGGPFLFGDFSAADAMYAPMVPRLTGYGWPLEGALKDYADAIEGEPAFVQWKAAALDETHVVPSDEVS